MTRINVIKKDKRKCIKKMKERKMLMTFVQSGMPPRLPAQDQCMLSHDISACSAT